MVKYGESRILFVFISASDSDSSAVGGGSVTSIRGHQRKEEEDGLNIISIWVSEFISLSVRPVLKGRVVVVIIVIAAIKNGILPCPKYTHFMASRLAYLVSLYSKFMNWNRVRSPLCTFIFLYATPVFIDLFIS